MKFINKILIASSLLIGAASCKKQLDLRPTDAIDETRAFRTVTDLQEGLIGVYSGYGVGKVNGIYIGSILADEVKLSDENRGFGQFSFKWQYSAAEGEHNVDFFNFYRVIDRVNRVLRVVGNIPAANAAETAQKNRIMAELHAFRGMAHYELLRRFMPAGYDANALGVAIMLQSDITAAPSRNTVGDVVAQINADLTAARAVAELPDAVPDGLRLSKAAVAAYQARVALLSRNWSNAEQFATDAITLSGKTLATRTQFPNIWTDASEAEVIFRLRNNYGIKQFWRDEIGDVQFEPSEELKSQYNRTTDIRFTTYFGSASGDTSIITKYPGSALQGPQNNDVKDIRIAEMYLIRAEARAEQNNLSGAADDLNAVRAARISGYTNVSFGTKAEAIDAIMNERFKELAYEGFRFFDLKRRNLPVERFASDVQSPNWQTLPTGDYRFALPLSQAQILANPNSQQNPGY